MLNLFQFSTIKKVGFEDVLHATSHPHKYILINTLPANNQECLINGTTPISMEEEEINNMLNKYETKCIIVYGKNGNDETVEKKCKQLLNLGFYDVYMYVGGLFEWLLLQDVYGASNFMTSSKVSDILHYRPSPSLK